MTSGASQDSQWLSRLRANAARRAGARPKGARWAISFEGERLTHAELVTAVEHALSTLEALDFRRGDLVAVLAPASLGGICLLHAFLEAGIVMLPLNARLSEAELIDALASTRVKALWVESASGTADSDRVGRRNLRMAQAANCALVEFTPMLDSTAAVVGTADKAGRAGPVGPTIRSLWERPEGAGGSALNAEVVELDDGSRRSQEARRAALAAQGAALVLRTSGTTGRPKGAVLSLANLIASASASQALLETSASDRWLLCMPIFHIGGLSILARSVLDASSVVVHPQFEATRVASSLVNDGVTCVSLVATMLHRLIEACGEARAPASLRLLLLGGGPATQALLERAERLGYPVAPTYGLTEAASQVATRPPRELTSDSEDLAGGLEALPGVELRIAKGAAPETSNPGNSVDAGDAGEWEREGEIEVRGPNVMLGYLDAPRATAKVLREGWLATGDFGRLDAAGRLRVLDRRSDLIVSGGENIYPAEIESVLAEWAEVEEAAVVGRSDAEFGARPIAYLVLREGVSGDVAALRRHCEARLARFKVPVAFYFREALPRTPSGKVMRRALVETGAAGEAGDEG